MYKYRGDIAYDANNLPMPFTIGRNIASNIVGHFTRVFGKSIDVVLRNNITYVVRSRGNYEISKDDEL